MVTKAVRERIDAIKKPLREESGWAVTCEGRILITTLSRTRTGAKEALLRMFDPREDNWRSKTTSAKWDWLLSKGYKYKAARVVVAGKSALSDE